MKKQSNGTTKEKPAHPVATHTNGDECTPNQVSIGASYICSFINIFNRNIMCDFLYLKAEGLILQ